MPSRSCRYCGLRDSGSYCPVFKRQIIDINKLCCPNFVKEILTCELCGQKTLSPQILLEDSSHFVICTKCADNLNTCGTCSKSITCDFETNPSPLPKAVMKQLRQGNQILQMQVKNPERIRETCEKNCECFDKEKGCKRENDYCDNYTIILTKERNK